MIPHTLIEYIIIQNEIRLMMVPNMLNWMMFVTRIVLLIEGNPHKVGSKVTAETIEPVIPPIVPPKKPESTEWSFTIAPNNIPINPPIIIDNIAKVEKDNGSINEPNKLKTSAKIIEALMEITIA